MSKINKALDYNKLLESQRKGKLLKKILKFPLYAPIKYDGNYTTHRVENGKITHTTSGGLNYRHLDNAGDIFNTVRDGVYLAERIAGFGKLGDRRKCNLTGPKSDQQSNGHSYKVFDYLTLDEYDAGYSITTWYNRDDFLRDESGLSLSNIVSMPIVTNQSDLEARLKYVVNRGYEGIILVDPNWKWENTTSRRIDFCKYKKRPTVDLLCYGVTDAENGTKYEGLIGSLLLRDSNGRHVSVGSGMSDTDRHRNPDYFIGKVVEVFYEQIMDTYIQPSFGSEYEGVLIRGDKNASDID